MTIQVRQAQIEEAGIVYHTMKEAFHEYSEQLYPPLKALSETTQDVLNVFHQGGGAVIAWSGAQAVGSARYKLREKYMYIGRVSVMPHFRNRGVGKRMLDYLEKLAKLKGRFEARVEVRLSLPENVRLYKKLHYEVMEHHRYPVGTDSWYVMRKRL